MKTTAAIFLSVILLFNWFGDRLLTFYLQEKGNVEAEARLVSNSYDESGLISLKVPITHLSYYYNSTELENVSGKIEINGVQYNYVKRRIYNDSLEVLCVPDQIAITVKAVRDQFLRFAFDLQQIGQGKRKAANTYASRHSSQDYYQEELLFRLKPDCFALTRKHDPGFFPVNSLYIPIQEQPPEVI